MFTVRRGSVSRGGTNPNTCDYLVLVVTISHRVYISSVLFQLLPIYLGASSSVATFSHVTKGFFLCVILRDGATSKKVYNSFSVNGRFWIYERIDICAIRLLRL